MKEKKHDAVMELMCAVVDLKEKMKTLYAGAAAKCSDDVGTGTFKMLEEMETEHLARLREIHEGLEKGGSTLESCRLYDSDMPEKSEVIRQIARKGKFVSKACLDDIAAIDGGMDLENRSLEFYYSRLKQAVDPAERDFLNSLISEERAHYILLADLKFYYIDTEHWFMEKGRTDLDGAGAVS